MTLIADYLETKGFSRRLIIDVVNSFAVVMTAAVIFKQNSPASFVTWWAFTFIAGVLLLLVAAGVFYRSHAAGVSVGGVLLGTIFVLTLLNGLLTISTNLFALLGRVSTAQFVNVAIGASVGASGGVVLILAIICYLFLLRANVRPNSISRLWWMLGFVVLMALIGIGMGVLAGFSGRVTVSNSNGFHQASVVMAISTVFIRLTAGGVTFANLARNWRDEGWRIVRTVLQILGLIMLSISAILHFVVDSPWQVLYWVGAGFVLAGSLLGIVVAIFAARSRYRNRQLRRPRAVTIAEPVTAGDLNEH